MAAGNQQYMFDLLGQVKNLTKTNRTLTCQQKDFKIEIKTLKRELSKAQKDLASAIKEQVKCKDEMVYARKMSQHWFVQAHQRSENGTFTAATITNTQELDYNRHLPLSNDGQVADSMKPTALLEILPDVPGTAVTGNNIIVTVEQQNLPDSAVIVVVSDDESIADTHERNLPIHVGNCTSVGNSTMFTTASESDEDASIGDDNELSVTTEHILSVNKCNTGGIVDMISHIERDESQSECGDDPDDSDDDIVCNNDIISSDEDQLADDTMPALQQLPIKINHLSHTCMLWDSHWTELSDVLDEDSS